jgi:hypothetical protein
MKRDLMRLRSYLVTLWELGVGLGLHVAAYDVSLSSSAIGSEAQKVTAPLPWPVSTAS